MNKIGLKLQNMTKFERMSLNMTKAYKALPLPNIAKPKRNSKTYLSVGEEVARVAKLIMKTKNSIFDLIFNFFTISSLFC